MIKIDDKLIEHLSKLSRLTFDESEKLKSDLQKIIDYFEILSEVDTESIEPMYTPIEEPCKLRELEPRVNENVEGIIENFPEKEGRLIKVPSIYG
ncbi:Asp-tRNA(Asn)/Glu-tRNA(Gln) amidotransferase subunit GatC [Fervidobacterium islandicum]|uniref:Asp-tRNA(Asn)/Glu-tRNA(Gln) amidotransferase subunit GatC n=1 Tax=Fervidobacterium islandicum TaxID=2423 RepID=UPI003A77F87F